ncbi:anti-sigma factor family protein [Nocardia asteroides]|uniref:anti-sigma factor family protein n=1 Tax=Nocardia asteroides TaxID=1824 RepID=UPI001E2F2174|nr:Asp23/Gls24 family envelope stress response protein [Nocardia asteroides]UGT63965.1 Asp23/Gls24 family envelope stress response protein [Nocardia asteroides]
MAVNSAADHEATGYRLPCGRDLEQVWDRLDAVEAGLGDEHETHCPHCATARESLRALRVATAELIAEPEPAPPDLTARIMSAVRAEVRRGRTMSLATPEPGGVEVSERAVAAVLRFAADSVPGVRTRRCRIKPVGTEPDGRAAVEVELAFALAAGTPVGGVLPVVRQRVSAALNGDIGVSVRRLDVVVADLYVDDAAPRRSDDGGPR